MDGNEEIRNFLEREGKLRLCDLFSEEAREFEASGVLERMGGEIYVEYFDLIKP